MTTRARLLPLLLIALSAPVMAATPELPSDSRIKLLPYDESDVYTITTKYGYQTNVVFGSGESVETVSVGDRSLWQIIPAGNRLFIRPMQESISTNMTILTNRRSYQFDLKSVSLDDKDAANIYVAKFVYPNERGRGSHLTVNTAPPPPSPPPTPAPPPPPAPVTAPPAPPPEMPAPPVPPTASSGPGVTQPVYPNYNYTYTGPDTLAPLQVYDNGKQTFIRYLNLPVPPPKVYAMDASGKAAPVVYTAQDKALVLDKIATTFELRYASGSVMVYNELMNPGN